MFDRLKRLWKGIVSMFSYTTFKNILGKDVALTQAMIDAINDWKNMLSGKADWCESYVESRFNITFTPISFSRQHVFPVIYCIDHGLC